ncbi:MAG: site-specific DNA-methyltransferase [Chryseobacterium sp.]|uniref:site-specific DNA-methyltransferase n=1 Tax=Chryseobacterium sp. TaxID=1871047 RepID=UPI0025BC9C87|nr:site-specific DNA-methyltransferase [Chryseobacterium sp.]MCJ7932633.1 site-specific DNA-methyltransferase [Chryseobacterium sp.]
MNDKLDLQSTDITSLNIEKIGALFPNCLTETAEGKKIDFDLLKQELSTEIIEGNKERYRLEWPGKREAIVTANIPTTKTLRPVREDSVDFDTTENIYIEGDNLEVLKLLQESYLNKIKMIYIDPPYNTGKDFVYKDNFAKAGEDELLESGQKDEYNQKLIANPETNGRYHSDWLSMMYPRLKLARNLLTDDGVIFISINNYEIHNVRKICDEIFGETNFIECITWNKRVPKNDKGIGNIHEYIIIYVKDNEREHIFKMPKEGLDEIFDLTEKLKKNKVSIGDAEKEIKKLYKKKGFDRGITLYNSLDENYRLWGKINMSWPNANTFGPKYDVLHPVLKKPVKVPERGWRWKEETFLQEVNYQNIIELHDGSYMCGKIWFAKDLETQPSSIKFLHEVDNMLLRSIISTKSDGGIETELLFQNKSIFSYPKPTSLLKSLIESIDLENSIILDFFSGSATSADAVIQSNSILKRNLKFIMIQLPEDLDESLKTTDTNTKQTLLNAIDVLEKLNKPHLLTELGKERIRRAANKIKEETNADIDYGFRVYRLDTSNMQDVYYKPQDYNQGTLDLFADNVKEDRTAEDLVTQVMLDWGLQLSLPIECKTIAGKEVYTVAGDSLYCCFGKDIDETFAKAIAAEKPLRIVFRDKGFKDDTAKENVKQLLKQLSPESEMKVI